MSGFGLVTIFMKGPWMGAEPEPRPGIVRLTGLVGWRGVGQDGGMSKPPDPHYRHRFPAELISRHVRFH